MFKIFLHLTCLAVDDDNNDDTDDDDDYDVDKEVIKRHWANEFLPKGRKSSKRDFWPIWLKIFGLSHPTLETLFQT